MLKLPLPLQMLIHDGQCVFLFGPQPQELAEAVKALCAMHSQPPNWACCEGNDFNPQSEMILASARQDPDGILPVPYLRPEAIENFFRVVLSGSNFGSYAALPYSRIEDFIAECRKRGIADEITHAMCDEFVFVELNGGYRNCFEVELIDGLVDVWIPEELEGTELTELSVKAALPAWEPQSLGREIVNTWLQERYSQDLSLVLKFERPAWIPMTAKMPFAMTEAFEAYEQDLGLGEMILQIATDQLPVGLQHPFPPASFVQIFKGTHELSLVPIVKVCTRAELGDLPAITHFRSLFQLASWLEVKDYPHAEDLAALGIPQDPDDEPLSACFPLTKFGGWPAWLQASENDPAGSPVFCQIDSMVGEFELFLGADLSAYLFTRSSTELFTVVQTG
jgi:hypothetical protein